LAFGAFLVALCAATLWETREIPPGTFEPLGSAPVPQAVAGLILALSLLIMWRGWQALRAGHNPEAPDVTPRWADALMVAAITIVYALALHFRVGRFDVVTTIYLIVTIGLLVRYRRRSLPAVVAVSAITGFGCQFVFTRIFVVDLPGAF
jgi:divalent metal cation (Fe/Co/Zn/Cd) transporter